MRLYLLTRESDGTLSAATLEKMTAALKVGGDKIPAIGMVSVIAARIVPIKSPQC